MPVFEYSGFNEQGKAISGIIDAESLSTARQKLRSSKVFPISIKETDKTTAKKEREIFSIRRALTRVTASDVTMMTRQISTLVGAGFPLVSALDTLLPQIKSHSFKKCIAHIKDSIMEGNSFAAALSLYPSVFSPLYINMVSAGESSGTLEIVLERLADMNEKQQALTNRIKSALAYPIFMCFIGALVLFILLTYIIPTISTIFTEMNQVLPAPTQFLINTSHFLKSYWWVILMSFVGIGLVVRKLKKTQKGRYYWDKMILNLPIIGTMKTKLAVSRFCRTLGSLLENGVPMLSALEIVKNIVGNVLLSDAISNAIKEVGKGQGLGVSLSESKLFPNLSIQMILVGEQSGELESMLKKIADVYENEVESSVLSLTSLLEPFMILIMGVVVGYIVLSICLPIFEMNKLVR